ncbi:MAG: hypothetical protein CL943_02745 [Candidatus Diapherotrites archaeon]|uniref:Proteasome assembly chaperone family protein n=1 Tax=Candidatus Iainarchaeum sp. TaxID=3101447 RepID=A0A2D6M1A1_9ARCH|nr:hypothetical protein [Candidatus Diapherotrites archaeon]|tara:strand:+ start:2954 stop:3730 length:777 start_codon:yes stop_codon:yes gene_type:complete
MATKIVFLKKKKLSKPIMLTGLPGIGLVGKICVDYFMTQFKTEKLAMIFSDSFPPSVHTKEGIISLIHDELHSFNFEGRDFLFLAGPVQPSLDFRVGSAAEHYEFASKIVEIAEQLGVKQIFTLAGINIGEKRMEKEPKVIAAATSNELLKELSVLGAKADKKEGLISGAAGLILGLAKPLGIEGACLMGETNSTLVYGDHGAAKKLIELLVKKFGFKVDMKSIEKESKKIEDAFKKLAEQFDQAEEEESVQGPSYVR